MSDTPLGRYHFLTWARRGIGATVSNPDGGSLPSRASLSVQLSVSVQQGATTNTVQPQPLPVQMFGPGDVIGVDPRHVIRTEPRDSTVTFEPNYLCGIEFDTPDFPWLFTPAAPNSDRLRPWVALVVLRPDEFTQPSVAPNPLPVIDVSNIAALPNLADSWNWAHVQVSGDTPIADAMASAPGNVISRLLCPRRLDAETSYTAFLVPAFEIGRQAGVGQDVSAITTADPAWTSATAAPLRLPFYYQFGFHTSDAGDFESLVRRLVPQVLTADVGISLMDVTHPYLDVRGAGPPPLGLQGALQSLLTKPTDWNDPQKTAFQTDVQAFINNPPASFDPTTPDPIVAPPIYGRWHAAVQAVDRTAAGWVDDLNLDPRDRSAGGMGTQVVQTERTALMASAWQQVDGVIKANQVLHQAQLARATLQQIFRAQFVKAQPDTVMTITSPLHSKLLASPRTIQATVRASRVPERMLSGAFRRVTRPRRRLGTTPVTRTPLLARVSSGEVAVVSPPKPPGGMVSIDTITQNSAPSWVLEVAKYRWWILLALIVLLLLLVVIAGVVGAAIGAAVVAVGILGAVWSRLRTISQQAVILTDLNPVNMTSQTVAAAPPNPAFAVAAAGVAPIAGPATGSDSAQAAAFRGATSDLFTGLLDVPADPAPAPTLELATLKTTLIARLDPVVTVPRRTLSLLTFASHLSWKAPDALEPIMAAPSFPQPMYEPLRDLSPDYVLPGVEFVKPDTLGLLLANPRFIEGYMVGLNFEMARQLLWNDYPTDQRGSYFRQFWDVSAYVPQPSDPTDPAALAELLKDIPPIHTWPPPTSLGTHPNRTDIAKDNLVLLVRGELFKRYPTAIVYAGKAKLDDQGSRVLDDTDERYPIFRGTLPNDITFLGFNLSREDAKGGTTKSPHGFFFVFQQQPSEPRFGLEPVEDSNPITHWADLAWTNFGSGEGPPFQLPDLGLTTRAQTLKLAPWRLASQVFGMVVSGTSVPDSLTPSLAPVRVAIAADANDPDDPANQWGINSAQTAYILLRLPFRILIHADHMLPAS